MILLWKLHHKTERFYLTKKYFLASFLSREKAFDILTRLKATWPHYKVSYTLETANKTKHIKRCSSYEEADNLIDLSENSPSRSTTVVERARCSCFDNFHADTYQLLDEVFSMGLAECFEKLYSDESCQNGFIFDYMKKVNLKGFLYLLRYLCR